MAYPVAATPYGGAGTGANPAYTGIFIPTIWSGKLIEKFYDATVLAAIANTDYEGEISSKGDKVVIRTRPNITIRNYEADQVLVVERPSSNVVELLIDQGRYFNTVLDDVMEVQSDINQMSMWADDASEQMKINIDTYVLNNIVADISADNVGATAGRISNDINLGAAASELVVTADGASSTVAVLDLIIRMGQVLDEQNIPETGRWLVIPAWIAALIKKSDLKDASLSGDGVSILRNGRLGMIDRFTLYMSNHLPLATGVTTVFAGHNHGLTFASQLTKIETLRSESTFGTLLRGLQVFGHQVVDGTALTAALVKKS